MLIMKVWAPCGKKIGHFGKGCCLWQQQNLFGSIFDGHLGKVYIPWSLSNKRIIFDQILMLLLFDFG